MNKQVSLFALFSLLFVLGIFFSIQAFKTKDESASHRMNAKILAKGSKSITLQDENHIIYTFESDCNKEKIGDDVVISYTGLLDKNNEIQTGKIIKCNSVRVSNDEDDIPTDWSDDGIFKEFYILASDKLKTLTLDEKIGQLLLVRYPGEEEMLRDYPIAGFIFFEKDFKDKTKDEVKMMITNLQKSSSIPLLTAVDEEGGKVVRVSSNPLLRSSKFSSPSDLYTAGGFHKIELDTIEKSALLNELGLNLNLAPVVDVSTDVNDYMYDRTLGKGPDLTSTYAKTVIEASKGTKVSYTLKHFPGYGNNADTHQSGTTDDREYDDIKRNDLPPFAAGIEAGGEAVLVSHNTVANIDRNNPASLSPSIHNLLRNELKFTGIVMTDDLAMGAVSSIPDATVKALLAGNDLILTTDYKTSFDEIKKAVEDGSISHDLIDKLAFRILAWKYYKGMMFEVYK